MLFAVFKPRGFLIPTTFVLYRKEQQLSGVSKINIELVRLILRSSFRHVYLNCIVKFSVQQRRIIHVYLYQVTKWVEEDFRSLTCRTTEASAICAEWNLNLTEKGNMDV